MKILIALILSLSTAQACEKDCTNGTLLKIPDMKKLNPVEAWLFYEKQKLALCPVKRLKK